MNNQHNSDKYGWQDQEAHSDFERAHFKSFVREILSQVTRSNNDLLPFDEVRKRLPLKGQHDTGQHTIPLDHVVGSVNRSHDFDRAFLPREVHIRDRWENIDRARLKEISLPPIEVYKIGDVYFVKDGNHRVSVARQNGQAFIDANVIEIDISVELTPETNINDLILKQEYSEFLEATHLNQYLPDAKIELSLPGMYDSILEHIHVHQWYMGQKHERPFSDEEAIKSWYKKVYLPIIKVIRAQNVLADFPGRTETDLYLWIVTHQYYLMERRQGYVNFEEAAKHYVSRYSNRPMRKLHNWFRKFRKSLGM